MEEQNMKTFGDVKTGDKIYTIDEDFRIRELYVCGVEDIRLAHSEMHLKTLSSTTFKVYMKETKSTQKDVTLFSCIESAQLERNNMKDIYAARQCRLAMQAFRRMKKAIPNVDKQKQRVLLFFQMIEAKEE
jgi:hypothetical protein